MVTFKLTNISFFSFLNLLGYFNTRKLSQRSIRSDYHKISKKVKNCAGAVLQKSLLTNFCAAALSGNKVDGSMEICIVCDVNHYFLILQRM